MKIETIKRNYNIALLVLVGVLIGSMVSLSLRPTAWAFVIIPVLGGVCVALLWIAIARFFFCRDAARLLAPSFKKPIRLALIAPAWAVSTLVLLTVPSDTTQWNETLANALSLLMTLLCLLLFVCALVGFGARSIYKGYEHKRNCPATETSAYRNAPFAVALGLFLFSMGVLALGSVLSLYAFAVPVG